MIPDEAVEAVPHEAVFEAMSALSDKAYPHVTWDEMRGVLAAALPHLMQSQLITTNNNRKATK